MNQGSSLITFFIIEFVKLCIVEEYYDVFFMKNKSMIFKRIAFAIAYAMMTITYIMFHNVILNLIVMLVGIFIMISTYEGKLRKKILFSILILAISCELDITAAVFINKNSISGDYDIVSSYISVFLFLISVILLKNLYYKQNKNIIEQRWIGIISMSIISICIMAVLDYDKSISSFSAVLLGFALLLLNLILYYLYNMIIEKNISEQDNIYLREQMKAYEMQIQMNIDNDRKVRSIRHDLKYHLNELLEYAYTHREKEIINYIEQMLGEVHVQKDMVDTGSAMDGVLNYMIAQAQERKISVDTHIAIPESMVVNAFDFNVIIGNLMENAIEASERISDPKIKIDIRYNEKKLFIVISNKYNGKVKKLGNRIISLKENKKEHGVGLANIKSVVQKYHGETDIRYDENWFLVNIMMHLTESD